MCTETGWHGTVPAMDSTLGSAIIGGAVTLAVFVAGGVAGAAKDRAAGRDAAKKEARAAVEDLLRAALDIQITLAVLGVRRRDFRSRYTVMARSIVQFAAGHLEGHPIRGAAEGLDSAMSWRNGVDIADEAAAVEAVSRLNAAAAKAAMLEDQLLRSATSAVTDAVGNLMRTWEAKPTSATRRRAVAQLETAVGDLGEAARAYDGRTGTGWLRRLTRLGRTRS